jgi:hypothetical protein
MTSEFVLSLCCTGIAAASGCAADSPAVDTEKTQVAEVDIAASPEGVDPDSIGAFHLIRVANTQLCLQPQGGSAGDVPVELHQCNPSAAAQNWLFVSQSGGREVVNQQSGMCLRYGADGPPSNGARPMMHSACNVFGGTLPASNSLWKLSSLTGFSTFMTDVGHHDIGFCLDVPDANPFDGAALQIYRCNRTPAQIWVVGVE